MATWPWSHTSQEAREINTDQFGNLLAGIDCIRKFNSRLRLNDSSENPLQSDYALQRADRTVVRLWKGNL